MEQSQPQILLMVRSNNAKVNTNAAIVTSKISGLTQAIDGGSWED